MMANALHTATAGNGKPKLLDQVRHAVRVRHLALSTEKTYVDWIRRFILFHGKRHPLEMGKQEVTAFLTDLAVDFSRMQITVRDTKANTDRYTLLPRTY